MSGIVYFIEAGAGGPIKIGFTGGPIEKRVEALQTGWPPITALSIRSDGSASRPRMVTDYCTGAVWPSLKVIKRIRDVTNGAVMPNDFLFMPTANDFIEAAE